MIFRREVDHTGKQILFVDDREITEREKEIFVCLFGLPVSIIITHPHLTTSTFAMTIDLAALSILNFTAVRDILPMHLAALSILNFTAVRDILPMHINSHTDADLKAIAARVHMQLTGLNNWYDL